MGSSWIRVTKYFINVRLEVLGSVWCCVHSGLLDNGLEIIASALGVLLAGGEGCGLLQCKIKCQPEQCSLTRTCLRAPVESGGSLCCCCLGIGEEWDLSASLSAFP